MPFEARVLKYAGIQIKICTFKYHCEYDLL